MDAILLIHCPGCGLVGTLHRKDCPYDPLNQSTWPGKVPACPDCAAKDAEIARLRAALREELALLELQPQPRLGEFHWPAMAKRLKAALR